MEYRMSTVSADADENVVDLIAKELKEEGYRFNKLKLSFIGFEAASITTLYLKTL